MDIGAQAGQPTTIDLEPGSEWRFELEGDEDIAVRVSPSSVVSASIACTCHVHGKTARKRIVTSMRFGYFLYVTSLDSQ